MARKPQSHVVTANHLLEGHSVYLSSGHWVARFEEAEVAVGGEALESLLATAKRDAAIVVGPYAIAVERATDGRLVPVELRERARLAGPSVGISVASVAA
ncbi:MAG: DUF2849 domain-containing protein [Rhizobiales bacterium]|nr:DUF2849 domain-containing protein [Hyphomicrobiales bacterium]